MIASFIRPEDSKEIYFKLNNSFQLSDPIISSTYKISGLYAIYKGDICLYVGQSKNIPSRLSTHLTGRYSIADRVDIYFICQDSFENFHEKSKNSQTSILLNNESYLINALNPTENIIVDRECVSNKNIFISLHDGPNPPYHDMQIFLDSEYITIVDEPYFFLDTIDSRVLSMYKEHQNEISKVIRNHD